MQSKIEKLEIDKQKFEELRTNPQFISILQFARVINALIFCLQSYIDYKDLDSLVAKRQQFRSTFLLIGFLHEGFDLLDKLEKDFSGKNFFDDTLGKLATEPKIEDFRKKVLVQIRNTNSFHFEPKVVTQTLKLLNLNEYILISFEGSSYMGMYFPLADELDFNFWVRDTKDQIEEIEKFSDIISLSWDTTVKFVKAAEEFMITACQQIL